MLWSDVKSRDDVLLYLISELDDVVDEAPLEIAGKGWKVLLGYQGAGGLKHRVLNSDKEWAFHVGDDMTSFPNFGSSSRGILDMLMGVAGEYERRFM